MKKDKNNLVKHEGSYVENINILTPLQEEFSLLLKRLIKRSLL
jgi:hypothetical protein